MDNTSQRNSVIVHPNSNNQPIINPNNSHRHCPRSELCEKRVELGNEINTVLQKTEIVLDQVVSRLGTFHTLDAEIKNVCEKFNEYNDIRRSKRFKESQYIDKLRMVHRLIEVQEQVQLLTNYVKEFTAKMCDLYPIFDSFLHEIKDQMGGLKHRLQLTDAAKCAEDLELIYVPEFRLSQPIPHIETHALLQDWEKMQVHKRMSYFLRTIQDMCPAPAESGEPTL